MLLVAALAYFWSTSGTNALALAGLCCLLSLASYFALISRNAVLLSGRPVAASASQLVEAVGKVALFALAVLAQGASTKELILGTGGRSLLSAPYARFLLAWLTRPTVRPYREPIRPLVRKIAAIGSAGLLNWRQLHVSSERAATGQLV